MRPRPAARSRAAVETDRRRHCADGGQAQPRPSGRREHTTTRELGGPRAHLPATVYTVGAVDAAVTGKLTTPELDAVPTTLGRPLMLRVY